MVDTGDRYVLNGVRITQRVRRLIKRRNATHGDCIECGSWVNQSRVGLQQIGWIVRKRVCWQLALEQVACGYDKQHIQFPRQTIKRICQPSHMLAVINLIQVSVTQIENPTLIVGMKIVNSLFDALLHELGLVLAILVENTARK